MQIAIDGPAGAGKTSVAKTVAKKLGILYLDTGAMYRAVALKAIMDNVDTSDEKDVTSIMNEIKIEIKHKDGEQLMFLNGKNITDEIRTPDVSLVASNVSKFSPVRLKLVDMQRKIALENDVVMDGRDIGTYVLPNADYKFYISASPNVRAKRRFLQLKERGVEKDINELEKEISARDYQDMNREFAPLKPASDALVIDTSNISMDEVIKIVFEKIKERK